MLRMFVKRATKTGLESLNRDQLDRERIRLEQSEKRQTREIEELEQKKEQLFRDGTESVSDRQRLVLARKFKDVELMIQGRDKQIALLARNQQVINSLLQLSENQQTVSTLGIESVLKGVDLDAVKDFVDRTQAEHEIASSRFQSLTQSLTTFDSVATANQDDADTLAILEAMQQASHRGDGAAVTDELVQVTKQMRARSGEAFPRSLNGGGRMSVADGS